MLPLFNSPGEIRIDDKRTFVLCTKIASIFFDNLSFLTRTHGAS